MCRRGWAPDPGDRVLAVRELGADRCRVALPGAHRRSTGSRHTTERPDAGDENPRSSASRQVEPGEWPGVSIAPGSPRPGSGRCAAPPHADLGHSHRQFQECGWQGRGLATEESTTRRARSPDRKTVYRSGGRRPIFHAASPSTTMPAAPKTLSQQKDGWTSDASTGAVDQCRNVIFDGPILHRR